jgi:hypothetical protein
MSNSRSRSPRGPPTFQTTLRSRSLSPERGMSDTELHRRTAPASSRSVAFSRVRGKWLDLINRFFKYGTAQQYLLTSVRAVKVDPTTSQVLDINPATGRYDFVIPYHAQKAKDLSLGMDVILKQLLPDMYHCAEELLDIVGEQIFQPGTLYAKIFGAQVPADPLDQFPILGAVLSLATKQMSEKDFVDDSTIRRSVMYFLLDELLPQDLKPMFHNERREILDKMDLWEIRMFKYTDWRGCSRTEEALKVLKPLSFKSGKARKGRKGKKSVRKSKESMRKSRKGKESGRKSKKSGKSARKSGKSKKSRKSVRKGKKSVRKGKKSVRTGRKMVYKAIEFETNQTGRLEGILTETYNTDGRIVYILTSVKGPDFVQDFVDESGRLETNYDPKAFDTRLFIGDHDIYLEPK